MILLMEFLKMGYLFYFMLGFGLFLLGVVMIGKAIDNLVRDRLSGVVVSCNLAKSCIAGTISSALLHSSSLVSVVLVELADSGLIPLAVAFAAMVGANIGTTATVGIAALRASWLVIPLIILAALTGLLSYLSKRGLFGIPKRYRGLELSRFAGMMLGLASVIYGLDSMQNVTSNPETLKMLQLIFARYSTTVWSSFLTGTVVTAICQSSTVVNVVLISLVREGVMPLTSGIGVMIGSNLGTCITAIIASMRKNGAGRNLALANAAFNLIGGLCFMPFTSQFCGLLSVISNEPGMQLAYSHVIFNMVSAVVVFPLIRRIYPEKRR